MLYKSLSKFYTVVKCNLRGYCRSITMESPLNLSINERLCPSVRPVHYKLLLQPDTTTGLFKGNVIIDVSILQEKNNLYFHSKSLQINKINVTNNKTNVPISKFIEVQQLEQLSIHFDDAISAGDYQIEIDFNGDLTHKIVGLYLSNLTDNRTMVASKFQPTYARQAFPCFDEPNFKATYDISLVKPSSYIALSNMNEVSRSLDDSTNLETVNFATSVPMSTYLACFVICDFKSKEAVVSSKGIGKNFTLRSFAQRDQLHKIDFAQDIGKRATEFYINYYKVPFPLPKLDMIAIPDYVSGATEHWGLITYRETSFLVDEATASAQNKVNVANTIAHELAHMWFGNLVTMKWWDEVWLNEGFASYMQVKALNAIEPSWTMLDQFLTRTLHKVLVTDAKLSSHPIVQTVATPDQITAIFDTISYSKGSSVLRMLEGFMGEDNFEQGVSDYLKKFSFENTVTQDLLSCLEPYFARTYSDRNLTYIMDTWTRQMGYPVLNVSRGEAPNTFVITQKRFLLDPEAVYENDSPFNYRWSVPITYKTDNVIIQDVIWFPDTNPSVTIKLESDAKWIKINNNQVGYYRVSYSQDMWRKLITQLKNNNGQLTISDRSHLLDDIFALAEANMVPYDLALDLTAYLINEEDFVPWETAATIFQQLFDRLRNTPAHDKLKKYMQHLVQPLYAKQSWEWKKTSVIQSLLRTRILTFATKSELPDAMARIRSIFIGWLENHNTLSAIDLEPDLRTLVYYKGMETASESEWDKLWSIYLKEEDAQEQSKLRRALAAPRDTNILNKYLTLAWDETNIRSQDYLNVLQYISANPHGTQLVWDDVRARWPKLVERFTLNSRYLGILVPGITSKFNTELKLKEMEAWFEKYPDAGAGASARDRALETVRNNIKWAQTHLATVSTWLETKQF